MQFIYHLLEDLTAIDNSLVVEKETDTLSVSKREF
jgi:hypothetical protein